MFVFRFFINFNFYYIIYNFILIQDYLSLTFGDFIVVVFFFLHFYIQMWFFKGLFFVLFWLGFICECVAVIQIHFIFCFCCCFLFAFRYYQQFSFFSTIINRIKILFSYFLNNFLLTEKIENGHNVGGYMKTIWIFIFLNDRQKEND